jgi:hypothetical protein
MYQSEKWKVGNLLLDEVNGEKVSGHFDTNMHMGEDQFIMEPSSVPAWGPITKKIEWVDNSPYFIRLDGTLAKANWIHCWGSYKFRTHELLEKAGLV